MLGSLARRRWHRSILGVECLEDRRVLSTLGLSLGSLLPSSDDSSGHGTGQSAKLASLVQSPTAPSASKGEDHSAAQQDNGHLEQKLFKDLSSLLDPSSNGKSAHEKVNFTTSGDTWTVNFAFGKFSFTITFSQESDTSSQSGNTQVGSTVSTPVTQSSGSVGVGTTVGVGTQVSSGGTSANGSAGTTLKPTGGSTGSASLTVTTTPSTNGITVGSGATTTSTTSPTSTTSETQVAVAVRSASSASNGSTSLVLSSGTGEGNAAPEVQAAELASGGGGRASAPLTGAEFSGLIPLLTAGTRSASALATATSASNGGILPSLAGALNGVFASPGTLPVAASAGVASEVLAAAAGALPGAGLSQVALNARLPLTAGTALPELFLGEDAPGGVVQGANEIVKIGSLDPAALDRALDQFLGQLDQVGDGVTETLQRFHLSPWLIGLAAGALAVELVRRRLRRRAQLVLPLDGDEHESTLSWLPGLGHLSDQEVS